MQLSTLFEILIVKKLQATLIKEILQNFKRMCTALE